MRRGIGYVRVSRVAGRGGESFLSPELQRERILQAAVANDVEIVGWFEDLDQSGGKWERPGFQAALEAIDRGEASVVAVARLTRFARSVLDTHKGLARLEAAGASLLAADVNVDVTTSTGKLVRDVLAALAEFELEVARENWQAAKQSAVARGVKIAPRAPLGYRFDAGHRLDPDPATAHLIPELFERRAAGASRREIVNWLHAQTGVWIRLPTVGDLIRNRSYLGEVSYGQLVKRDAHPPLVTEQQWDEAQGPAIPRAPTGAGTLLAGVLVCASCGGRMVASSGALRADESRRLMYRCQKLSRRGPCPSPVSVIRERADDYVTAELLSWAEQTAAEVAPGDTGELDDAREVVARAQAELGAYLRTVEALVEPDAFQVGAEQRQRQVDEARAALARLRAERGAVLVRATVLERWPRLSEQERRRLIAAVVERVEVHRSSGRPVPFADRCTIVFRDRDGPPR